ncbi:hypothetical protein VP01_3269g2 [Puccinia sorghi]|uniref:DNA-directed RNA polymerases I, II, and III subunit RPABC5 n=1 Tax=Puccinia sorghi TaxID=27349 RepID=A0A0L6UXZ2_9BASI|nr:hypothetical protein VP01_3269g2 [Puccinia sorghi]
MIIPIRCFSCGKVVGHLWELFLLILQSGISEGSAISHTRNLKTEG